MYISNIVSIISFPCSNIAANLLTLSGPPIVHRNTLSIKNIICRLRRHTTPISTRVSSLFITSQLSMHLLNILAKTDNPVPIAHTGSYAITIPPKGPLVRRGLNCPNHIKRFARLSLFFVSDTNQKHTSFQHGGNSV